MAKPKSDISRQEYKRRWRKNNSKDKRFNRPLNAFLKLKYKSIYEEYCDLFKSLDESNPSAKDLTKTTSFLRWKESLNGQTSEENTEGDESDCPVEVDEPVIKLNTYIVKDPEKNQTEPVVFAAAIQEIIPPDTSTEESETVQSQTVEPDTLAAAAEELISPEGVINIEFERADDIINEIIISLEQEEAIRGLLNAEQNNEVVHPQYQDADEGIGLNLEDEIDYELFDFAQEVDFGF